jgi:hypothetical protein
VKRPLQEASLGREARHIQRGIEIGLSPHQEVVKRTIGFSLARSDFPDFNARRRFEKL